MWLVSYVTCIDLIAQISLTRWSAFLFLDVLILKLIIILPTARPEIIILTARTTKNEAAFALTRIEGSDKTHIVEYYA